MIVTTKSGSRYFIDLEKKTWKKITDNVGLGDFPLRTSSGSFTWIGPICIGRPLTLLCPPINSLSLGRTITTNLVVSIED
jgi:hypothetical protein